MISSTFATSWWSAQHLVIAESRFCHEVAHLTVHLDLGCLMAKNCKMYSDWNRMAIAQSNPVCYKVLIDQLKL